MKGKSMGYLLLGLLVGYSAGCRATGIEHVSGDEFQDLIAEGQRANSAYWIQAVGATASRAYLEHGQIVTSTGTPKIQVVWTETAELPEEFLLDWTNLDTLSVGQPSSAIQNPLNKIGG
ncbi:MAG: hypothetical protein P8N31_10810 [Planctomycetota bacterium]|nr:hypothetical protein [Planctomycetota bacterium]MDG2144036.1 hypothetical protein [Planctomycetota bacterium]